jgi:hypothetical protein
VWSSRSLEGNRLEVCFDDGGCGGGVTLQVWNENYLGADELIGTVTIPINTAGAGDVDGNGNVKGDADRQWHLGNTGDSIAAVAASASTGDVEVQLGTRRQCTLEPQGIIECAIGALLLSPEGAGA